MLRIIVISLVVANLLLLGFQSSNPGVETEQSQPAAAVAEDARIPTIHLFSEMMQDQGLLSGNRLCFTLGPFHSAEDRDDVQTRLLAVSTRISERQTQALVEKGYWVFMPPYSSLLKANEALLSLQALGLKDVAIMYDGEWKNSISLGYFMRQENAQRRKKALEERGFKPMMRIQRQEEPRYWLDYEQEPGSGLIALDMQNRPNDFMQRPVPCPEADFLEGDALASRDTVENPAEAPPPDRQTSPPGAENGKADNPQTTVNPAGTTVQPLASEKDNSAELRADQNGGTTKENKQDASGDGAAKSNDILKTTPQSADEPDVIPGGKGETASGKAEAVKADKTGDSPAAGEPGEAKDDADVTAAVVDPEATTTAVDEHPPKLSVGTGPADIVSTEPEPAAIGVTDQDAENPEAGTLENKPDDGGDQTVDESKTDKPAAPTGDSAEQTAPQEAVEDNGNGTETVDG